MDGRVAWSECVAQEYPSYSPETIDSAWHALANWLAPKVLDVDLEPRRAAPILNEYVRGHQMAKAGIEMGVWALDSLKAELSLAHRIGGVRASVPVGVAVGIHDDAGTTVEKVRQYLIDGYRRIKMKIKPGLDIALLRPMLDEFGDNIPLAADANASYRLSDLDVLRSIDELGLIMLEQPLQHDDLVRHAALQEQLSTPICLDESITSRERVEDMLHLRAGQIVNVKAGRVGGFAAAVSIHDLCADNDLPVWCGGMLESGIGRAYNVALASLPNFTMPADLSPSSRYWERDIVSPEWTMSADGTIDVPLDRPGIGVHVDVDLVDDLTVRSELIES